MTKQDLAEKLNQLDPGASAQVKAEALAEMFGASSLTQELIEAIEAFALERRCTFIYDVSARHPPTFEKDDIY
jgi:hypothetical protein